MSSVGNVSIGVSGRASGPLSGPMSAFDVAVFEAERRRLTGIAYRMLGSMADAEDAVQEAWLRLSRTDSDAVENLPAWLTTVVARVSLNMLRARATRREEPIEADVRERAISDGEGSEPEQEALLADSVGLALLVVLDTLTPPERLAFVLHDMFDLPFDEIAPIVSPRSAAATSRRLSGCSILTSSSARMQQRRPTARPSSCTGRRSLPGQRSPPPTASATPARPSWVARSAS